MVEIPDDVAKNVAATSASGAPTGRRQAVELPDLDAIEARANAATAGPWRWRNSNGDAHLFGARTLVVMAFRRLGMHGAQPAFRDHETNVLVDAGRANINAFPDALFIAHARTDVPALVAALREARAERDAFLAALGAIATLPSASIAVRDIARHALLNGGAS